MHEGHRKRMYEKLKNGDGLYDHEILEILLFNAIPRKNTNPVAHELIKTFGSLSGVFAAEPERLMTVDGVGESVALYIKCVGETAKRINLFTVGIALLKNYKDFRNFVAMRMRGRIEEVLELYCLEKNGRVKRIFSFTDNDIAKVEVDIEKLSAAIATEKPHGIFIAHNHLSGNPNPSLNDDRFTIELQVMCSMNNVNLYDHCIYASDADIYSYFENGRIDEIKKNYSFKEIVDRQIKNTMNEKADKKQI